MGNSSLKEKKDQSAEILFLSTNQFCEKFTKFPAPICALIEEYYRTEFLNVLDSQSCLWICDPYSRLKRKAKTEIKTIVDVSLNPKTNTNANLNGRKTKKHFWKTDRWYQVDFWQANLYLQVFDTSNYTKLTSFSLDSGFWRGQSIQVVSLCWSEHKKELGVLCDGEYKAADTSVAVFSWESQQWKEYKSPKTMSIHTISLFGFNNASFCFGNVAVLKFFLLSRQKLTLKEILIFPSIREKYTNAIYFQNLLWCQNQFELNSFVPETGRKTIRSLSNFDTRNCILTTFQDKIAVILNTRKSVLFNKGEMFRLYEFPKFIVIQTQHFIPP